MGGKRSMTDEGTRVPMIASWPAGIEKRGRIVDDLVEFCDVMPTLCEVTGAELPKDYPGDGASIVPVLKGKATDRRKDWIYIWYRGKVMVRNKEYSLVAKRDGSGAELTRYKGAFDGEKLVGSALTDEEQTIKKQFEQTLARLAKTRLSGVDERTRAKTLKSEKSGKVVR